MKENTVMAADAINDIRNIFKVLTELPKRIMHDTRLTVSQLEVVKLLREASPKTVSELASRMYLHPATMVGILDRLELKGLIKRTRSEKDRRVVHIDLKLRDNELDINSQEVVQKILVKGLAELGELKLKLISKKIKEIETILHSPRSLPSAKNKI